MGGGHSPKVGQGRQIFYYAPTTGGEGFIFWSPLFVTNFVTIAAAWENVTKFVTMATVWENNYSLGLAVGNFQQQYWTMLLNLSDVSTLQWGAGRVLLWLAAHSKTYFDDDGISSFTSFFYCLLSACMCACLCV